MLRCWFGRHDPPMWTRQADHVIVWICPKCDREIGRSEYPVSEVLQRRQQVARVAHMQSEFLKKQREWRQKWRA